MREIAFLLTLKGDKTYTEKRKNPRHGTYIVNWTVVIVMSLKSFPMMTASWKAFERNKLCTHINTHTLYTALYLMESIQTHSIWEFLVLILCRFPSEIELGTKCDLTIWERNNVQILAKTNYFFLFFFLQRWSQLEKGLSYSSRSLCLISMNLRFGFKKGSTPEISSRPNLPLLWLLLTTLYIYTYLLPTYIYLCTHFLNNCCGFGLVVYVVSRMLFFYVSPRCVFEWLSFCFHSKRKREEVVVVWLCVCCVCVCALAKLKNSSWDILVKTWPK